MTKLGLIARADTTGLGHQSAAFHRHLQPDRTLIVDLSGQSASGKDLTVHPERFPGDTVIHAGIPTGGALHAFLDGLDAVFTMETPYNYELYTIARQKGIRTILQANWELLDYLQDGPHQRHLPDVLAFPSTWNLVHARRLFADRMEVIHLPVPIEAAPAPAEAPPTATRFLHVAGYPAVGDRNGTRDLLAALRYVKSEITVNFTCQRPGWLGGLIQPGQTPDHVTLVLDSAPPEDFWDLYAGQHALILPRRYGGLCLPLNEALGAGLPAIMPHISPNSRWLPPEWLTPATLDNTFMAKTLIDLYRSEPQALAAQIDRWATDEQAYGTARRQARRLAENYSWQAWLPYYREVIR